MKTLIVNNLSVFTFPLIIFFRILNFKILFVSIEKYFRSKTLLNCLSLINIKWFNYQEYKINHVDIERYLKCVPFSDILSTDISNKFWNYDVEDNVFALMRDKNGVIASIHSTATQWQHTFRIEITAKYALIELKGILSGTKSYGKESLRVIERLPKSSNGYKIKNQYYFSKDNSWKEEIDEFANIILKKLPIKTGNIYDALKVMDMVEKIYRADKKGV